MNTESFERSAKMLSLLKELLSVEKERLNGIDGYSLDEFDANMKQAIEGE